MSITLPNEEKTLPDRASLAIAIEPLLVNSEQAARLLCMSPRTLWGLTASGEIKKLKIGGSVRYSVENLRRFVAAMEAAAAKAHTN